MALFVVSTAEPGSVKNDIMAIQIKMQVLKQKERTDFPEQFLKN